ncbi:kinesin-domain-containing protein [Trametopsis cervina]|nr:kinesin-domain-containing protein [Trametopsis cervina]
MASRRTTGLYRTTRTTSKVNPPSSTTASSSRSQSVLSHSNASQRSDATTAVDEKHDIVQAPKTSKTTGKAEDSETNIRVVIRCRRRSEREVQENSPIIVSTNGRKSQEITIETATPVTSLGLVTLPPTRTYPFDVVFGPEADQGDIYHDVVSPMLDEVVQGYNCTLFAYGQTGTGKTYTMQGDLSRTPMGNPSAQAGMIPRVLFRLFHQLESSSADYTVKVSFVELYNEELRDLLASDLAAPIGSAQPMGMGGPKDGAGQLKIFDDASKKGVFIQGLEECCVKDAAHALALLTKGSERRQIAATKFNDHSSRSHSVFSITVHIKETSSIGDDLLKVGKLNLVDLAGSENIGRSGAENKRAREAGMINQSLLTLGRVINALVDRSSHVPYRESKLTRLLQDSLGGRTKTCIIATISPARSNMEETLSTLDYAIRAKSIRNKPELNQRMTRNALLKEYVGEIERLKADLMAAREKNGIFFSEETWQQMTAEQEMKDTEMQEAKKQVAIIESQLRNVREEFEQSIALLTRRDGELKEAKEKLQKMESDLIVKEGELKVTKGALEEEIVVREAYQENETVIDGVASGLKTVAHQSVNDLGRLFGKLERKTSVFTSNVQAVTVHTRKISSESRDLSTKLDDFAKVSKQRVTKIRTEAEEYRAKELEALAGISAKINQQIEKVQEILKVIRAKEEASDDAVNNLQSRVAETQDGIKAAFDSWSGDVRRHCDTTCKEAEASAAASYSSVEKAFKSLGSMTETILQEAQEYIVAERKSLQDAKALAENTTSAEVARLQSQNALLQRALETEKAKADRAKDELVKRIIVLLDTFTAERGDSLRDMFSEIAESNAAAETGMEKLGKDQGQHLETVIGRGRELGISLDKKTGESKRLRDSGVKAFGAVGASLKGSLTTIQSSLSDSVHGFSGDLKRTIQQSNAAYTEAYDDLRRLKRARVDAADAMATDTQTGYRYMQRGISSTVRNAESVTDAVISEASALSHASELYNTGATKHLSEIYEASQSLADHGAREDMPTGSTPRKRNWEFNDKWELTKNRESLLKDLRLRPSSSRSRSSLHEHLSASEEDESESEVAIPALHDEDNYSQPEEEDDTITMNSPPPAKSLASSTSSSSSLRSIPEPPPPRPVEIKRSIPTLKSNMPIKGTLVERPTNVLAGRPSRRIR